ncbi:MAG TPA: polya polymerase, partial [Desulfobaccales bacterium]|nr:polya polymerase [Desulfobaccales bacterium]
RMLERVQAVLSWYDLLYLEEKYKRWLLYFLGLVDHLSLAELEEMLGRFNLSPKQTAAILRGKEASEQALARLFRYGDATRPQIYHLLAPLDTEFILYMMAKSRHESSRKAISLYFTHLKHLKPELKGRDLLALGYQPGPMIKEMLDRLLEARLNEKVKSRSEERDFIRRYFGPA